MKKYYHFTSYENLESIGKNGLVPMSGNRTKSIGDKRCAVFFSDGIKNVILMYSTLLHYYNSLSFKNGIKTIEHYNQQIRFYNENSFWQDDYLNEINALQAAIRRIYHIMEYKNFFEYIEDGVYLTITNIKDIHSNDPKDCYTMQVISPKNINIVLLRNKVTNEIFDSREEILSYFMSITPIQNILENIYNIITIKNIEELYKSKSHDIAYYNSSNFEIIEVPIVTYLKSITNEKVKTIK